jgi:cobaltochelatase CobN
VQPFTVVYYSATGLDVPVLSSALTALDSLGGGLSLFARTQSQLFDQGRVNDFVSRALSANCVVITLHGGPETFPAWRDFEKALLEKPLEERPLVHVQPSGGDVDAEVWSAKLSSLYGQEDFLTARRYLALGGRDNLLGFLVHIYNLLSGAALPLIAPIVPPFQGLYHPDFPSPLVPEEYFKSRIDPLKPTVGLWFYQTYWLNGNLGHIDFLIRTIEAKGANVICVFHMRYKDSELKNPGADSAAEAFFLDGDRSRLDVLISPMSFSLNLTCPDCRGLLERLGVPVIQATVSFAPREVWDSGFQGLSILDVSISTAQPEFDGNIINVPWAFREEKKVDPITKALTVNYEPDPERTDKMVSLALNWANLHRTPPEKRRIAIIFHHYPPRNDRVGCAAGLDSFQSVVWLLKALKEAGYKVDRLFEGEDELAHELISGLTADRRWLTPEQMALKAEAHAGASEYLPWNESLPESVRLKMESDWGKCPGDLFVYQNKLFFSGLSNGHIFITIQPPRGYLENIEKIYHDMALSTPYHYLSHYRWLKEVWKAQAFIHVGKHGSLEWLPGKALGLSQSCYPDLAIMDVPNIYPYIINDPGEGTQAKRRSYACIIDHLIPAMTGADLYQELEKINVLVSDLRLAQAEDPAKVALLKQMIWQAVQEASLDKDLDLTQEPKGEDFDLFLEKLHAYLGQLSDSMIADGLHILGIVPEGKRLVEFIAQLTRVAGPGQPSLRETLASALGYDYNDLLASAGKPSFNGRTGSEVIKDLHLRSLELVEALSEGDYDPSLVEGVVKERLGRTNTALVEALAFICRSLVPNIRACQGEIDAVQTALSGSFVPPGPSGALSRGQTDILPTGRNFYSLDPAKVPSPAAWEVGKALGEALIESSLAENGQYPQNVGIIVYGTATMRSRGDDVAEILFLLGLKPIWRSGGTVEGLEVIPLESLARPRIDVTPRISGFFRDSFPNLVELLDKAVEMAARLNEPIESNFVKAHVLSDVAEYRLQGLSEEEAFREASFRVFGCPPGSYGAGVADLVESGQWQTQSDLGESYIRWSSHAYGRGSYGTKKPEAFRRALARMDVTVKNEDSREYDLLSCTDYYNYYGGLIVAAKTVRGVYPLALTGDSSDPQRVKTRTAAQEAKRVLRTRLVNPKWLKGLMRHGYKGAGDISHMSDVLLGWDATASIIDDWMFEKAARAWVLDKEMKEWMEKVNPFARRNILDKLLEAISRGLWENPGQLEEELREEYLELEGRLEDFTDDQDEVFKRSG